MITSTKYSRKNWNIACGPFNVSPKSFRMKKRASTEKHLKAVSILNKNKSRFDDKSEVLWSANFSIDENKLKFKESPYTKIIFEHTEIYRKTRSSEEGKLDEKSYKNSRNKFLNELPNLLRDHKNKFVAFVNNDIFISEDEESLVLDVIKKYGNIPFYFDKVTRNDDDIEIMSGKFIVSE